MLYYQQALTFPELRISPIIFQIPGQISIKFGALSSAVSSWRPVIAISRGVHDDTLSILAPCKIRRVTISVCLFRPARGKGCQICFALLLSHGNPVISHNLDKFTFHKWQRWSIFESCFLSSMTKSPLIHWLKYTCHITDKNVVLVFRNLFYIGMIWADMWK